MKDPNKWYDNNVIKSARLFELCNKYPIHLVSMLHRHVLKSNGSHHMNTSKKVMEDMANVHGRFVGLRFSNVYNDNAKEKQCYFL